MFCCMPLLFFLSSVVRPWGVFLGDVSDLNHLISNVPSSTLTQTGMLTDLIERSRKYGQVVPHSEDSEDTDHSA